MNRKDRLLFINLIIIIMFSALGIMSMERQQQPTQNRYNDPKTINELNTQGKCSDTSFVPYVNPYTWASEPYLRYSDSALL